jgi:hypothetical protein
MNDDAFWKPAWRPMTDAVGRDFAEAPPVFVADPIGAAPFGAGSNRWSSTALASSFRISR